MGYTLVPYSAQGQIWHWGTMATRLKKRTDTSTNRESDKVIVRLPEGMRAQIADMAARHGKSMNAEVVTALVNHILRDGEPDQNTVRNALVEMKQEIKCLREDILGAGGPRERLVQILELLQKDAPA
jgi:plasmid stability protein